MTLIKKVTEFIDSIRQDPTRLPLLDPTMANYEFLCYLECCNSLNIKPSITRFVRYNKMWKELLQK